MTGQICININISDTPRQNWSVWRATSDTLDQVQYLIGWDGAISAKGVDTVERDEADKCDVCVPITAAEYAQLEMLARYSTEPDQWAERARKWFLARWATRDNQGEGSCDPT